ncbi:MAG: Metallo-dependent phosphatase-like protein [Monoraphidium minutum]|nr:MAG: Metallo-dependent phosphatase-like protein [Monoraphidium minutum]
MARVLTILHFNDVYNIEPGTREPVGGAARFVGKVRSLSGVAPLVLFSGDAFNPSLMSTVTLGKQMVPVLNAAGVAAACLGNHDIDYGIDNFEALRVACDFPWLLANVMDADTGLPLGGCEASVIIEHAGIRVGLMGLAEREWVDTLPCVEPEDVIYVDYSEAAAQIAADLRARGAEVVVALTHMREPSDARLAAEVAGIDLVLGGHDHFYSVRATQPHGTLLVKSGTDFREYSVITLTLPADSATAGAGGGAADGAAAGAPAPPGGAGRQQEGAAARPRPAVAVERVAVDASVPEDPEVAAVVAEYSALMGSRMDTKIGLSAVDLDGRFETVRRAESNLGNFLCDILRRACSADVAVVNGGTFRRAARAASVARKSDAVHPAGRLTLRDLASILPLLDDTVVIEPTGAELLAALENGVSVVPGSVAVSGMPLEPGRRYKVATKQYLHEGKDGFEALAAAPVLVDSEECISLNTAARNYFTVLEVLNRMRAADGRGGGGSGGSGGGSGGGGGGGPGPAALRRTTSFARRWKHRAAAGDHIAAPGGQAECSGAGCQADVARVGNCVLDARGRYAVAPALEGRIVCLQPLPG